MSGTERTFAELVSTLRSEAGGPTSPTFSEAARPRREGEGALLSLPELLARPSYSGVQASGGASGKEAAVSMGDAVALPEVAQAFDADGNGVLDGVEVAAMLEAMGETADASKQRQQALATAADAARGRSPASPQKSSVGGSTRADPARSDSASRDSPQPGRVTSAEVAEQAAKAVAATEQPLWPYPRTMEEAVAEAMQEAADLAEQRANMTNKVTEAVAASSAAAAQNRDRNREAAQQRRQSQKLHGPNQGYRSRG